MLHCNVHYLQPNARFLRTANGTGAWKIFFYMQVFLHYHTYCNLINIRPLMLSFADMLRRGRSETISVCLGYDLNHQLNNMKTSLGEWDNITQFFFLITYCLLILDNLYIFVWFNVCQAAYIIVHVPTTAVWYDQSSVGLMCFQNQTNYYPLVVCVVTLRWFNVGRSIEAHLLIGAVL